MTIQLCWHVTIGSTSLQEAIQHHQGEAVLVEAMVVKFVGLHKKGTHKVLDTLSLKFEDSQAVVYFTFDSLKSVEGCRLYQIDEL
jgi:hypothetical protein